MLSPINKRPRASDESDNDKPPPKKAKAEAEGEKPPVGAAVAPPHVPAAAATAPRTGCSSSAAGAPAEAAAEVPAQTVAPTGDEGEKKVDSSCHEIRFRPSFVLIPTSLSLGFRMRTFYNNLSCFVPIHDLLSTTYW